MTAIEKPAILPDTFSGRTTDDFSIWHSQFELAAVANGWTTSPVKLQMIVLRLRGPALRAYHALPPAERSTYNKTVHQLRMRFSPTERASVHRATLRARRRRPDESLAELADDISLLVARAYPDLTDTGTIDQLALDAFVDSLDPQLKRRVRDADPSTLAGAVRRALVLDRPTTRPIAALGRPRITGNKPAALGSQLGCSPRQQLSPRITRPQLLRFLVVSSKTCWAHSNESCSRLTVWPLVRFLEPACQSCHGQIRSSVFLVGRRGICAQAVLSVVAPPVHRVGPPAREPGQYAMPLIHTPSHHHPLLLLTL